MHSQFESGNLLFQLSFSSCLFRVAEAPVTGGGQSLSQLGLLRQNTHCLISLVHGVAFQIISLLDYIYGLGNRLELKTRFTVKSHKLDQREKYPFLQHVCTVKIQVIMWAEIRPLHYTRLSSPQNPVFVFHWNFPTKVRNRLNFL